MSFTRLKMQLQEIIPLLEINRSLAYKEWMDGVISRGSFEYVSQRADMAIFYTQQEITSDLDVALKQCAFITIDLQSVIKDMPEKKDILENWLMFYKDVGFTDNHPVFDIPFKLS
jgi:hypothetical protein